MPLLYVCLWVHIAAVHFLIVNRGEKAARLSSKLNRVVFLIIKFMLQSKILVFPEDFHRHLDILNAFCARVKVRLCQQMLFSRLVTATQRVFITVVEDYWLKSQLLLLRISRQCLLLVVRIRSVLLFKAIHHSPISHA